jgi:hypothetical protein
MTATQVNTDDEFAKNPELKKKDLQELKCWLGTQMHLPPVSGTNNVNFFSYGKQRINQERPICDANYNYHNFLLYRRRYSL